MIQHKYFQIVLFLTIGILSIYASFTVAEEDAWSVLVDSQFDKTSKLVGWAVDPSEGSVAVVNKALEIRSLSGEGETWAGNLVTYKNGFSLAEATVKIEVDVASQNPGRDFFMVLLPKDGNMHRQPAVWININHSRRNNDEVLIRQFRKGQNRYLLKEPLPFKPDGAFRVSLTLTNGSFEMVVSNGEKQKKVQLLDLIGRRWLIYPFTVRVGTSQHGDSSEPAVVRVSRIRVSTTKRDEATANETEGNSPGKSEDVRYMYLDAVANQHFEDKAPSDNEGGWTDQGGNDLRYIPRGYQFFRNVPFHIVDKLEEIGNAYRPGCVSLKSTNTPEMPLESKPIEVNGKAPWLYFLQAAAWAGTYGTHCADYVVTYSDGSTAMIPLRVGKETADWWDPKDIENAVVAWDGQNPMFPHVGFYLYEWENPHPDKTVENIVLKSRDTSVAPMLIAITASDNKIPIGSKARRFHKQAYTICEYRQRPKTSLYWEKGPADVTVKRLLPIAKNSDVKQARIDVVRYRGETPTTVACTVGGVTMEKKLPKGELRAQFLITDKKLLKYFTENKENFDIHVTFSGENGIGTMAYESNPNERFIPGGEDLADKTHAITGVFQVTGFLPVHHLSGYVEYRPNPMGKPKSAETVTEDFRPAKEQPDLLGGDLCLNGMWQWQPGPVGLDVEAGDIPTTGWQDILVPSNDIKDKIFEVDKNCISAWLQKTIDCPKEWAGKRIVLHFESVADFGTVYCNGKKVAEHKGLQPFDVDLTEQLRLGETNTIHLFCQSVYKGIIPKEEKTKFSDLFPTIAKYKGNAYQFEWGVGAWDQKPEEIRLYLDGKDIAVKSSLNDVVNKGDSRYYRKLDWNKTTIYFSTPGNVPLEKIKDRLTLGTTMPGFVQHYTRGDSGHHWRTPKARDCGPWKDVSLRITGMAHMSDVFVKPSVRKMQLDVDVSLADVPAGGAVLLARVKDGDSTALTFDSKTIEKNTKTVTLSQPWNNPTLWGPSNPHLYYLELELKDQKTGKTLDRRFVRFGFREFWIEGPYFVFNGQKPYYVQGNSIGANFLPFHRHHVRWHYADANQQANMNMIRFHKGGTLFPEVLDVADEMGMLVMQETNYGDVAEVFGKFDPKHPEKTQLPIDWMIEQSRPQRNHPSLVMWGSENECALMREYEELTPERRNRAEQILRLDDAFHKMDPTRPAVDNGGHIFLYTDLYKDPRLDVVDGHYVNPRVWNDWKKKYGKPCSMGEISMGGPFGWTYQNEVRQFRERGEDPRPNFYQAVNAAARYMEGRLLTFRSQELSGLWPFGAMKQYHPFQLLWDDVDYWQATPPIPWPAMSGPDAKNKSLPYGRNNYNFYDPSVPRCAYLRTYDPLKDVMREVPKLEPRFSPEVIVQVLDAEGKSVPNTAVWLTPTDQPATPFGVVTDNDGKAWFWCRSGPGEYTAWVRHEGTWYTAAVTPAPVGEWMQVKTVIVRLPKS
ncbi:MAG: hypothetical protein JW849_11385 [Phycisphaerae bacterium]|nr:hypothetical protein [Phycisphaerae bacterium]